MEDNGVSVGVDIKTTGSKDALVVDRAQEDATVGIGAVDGAREGVLDVIVVAGVAVGAVEEDVVAVGDLVQRGGLHDAVVRRALVVEDLARAVEQRERVARHALDHDGRWFVRSGRRAALARRRAAEVVAVHLPRNPAVDAVIVATGVDNAAARVIADQGRALWCERSQGRGRGSGTDAVRATILVGGVVHCQCC